MSGAQLRVTGREFLPGCSGGLSEQTALVSVEVAGTPVVDAEAEDRFRTVVSALCPEEPLFGVSEKDWPTAFLIAPDDVNDERVARLGGWITAIAVGIQQWGRDPVWRGRVLRARSDGLRLALGWRRQAFCAAALDLAVQLAEQCLGSRPADMRPLRERFDGQWVAIQNNGLSPYTLRFIRAAVARGMPFDILPSYAQVGWGANAEIFDMSFTGHTSWMGSALARNKSKANRTLAAALLPVPAARVVTTVEEAARAAEELGWPVVVKPLDKELGLGVTAGITAAATLSTAFDTAARHSPNGVLIEEHVEGDDHRLLVVRDRLLMAVRRVPAGVTGDGVHTVRELVDRVNADPRRGTHRFSVLKRLALDDAAVACLHDQGSSADAVPAEGRFIRLRSTANITTGGTADDVTDVIHPDNAALAERAARIIGLDIAGVDFLTTDITRSWRDVGGAICEVNAQPGFSPHWLAAAHRDPEGEVIDTLFAGRSARIPTAAITGTNGKTTTTAMLHRMWSATGVRAAMCTTASVVIGEDLISTDNLSGQPGGRLILNDRTVEAAVFEMPRKGLIYLGHPCDRYDVAALLNVQDDHIGADGVDTLDQMTQLKAEVLERARDAVVINADDPRCLAARHRAAAQRHILVSADSSNPAVRQHRRDGGQVVFAEQRDGRRWIVLAAGDDVTPLLPLGDIPATLGGLLRVNESNAMFAAGLAWAQGLSPDVMRTALSSFTNSLADNPGRYNLIEGLPFALLLDYAHNPDGVTQLCRVVPHLPAAGRRILCSVQIGNRHPAHLTASAPYLAGCFDDFVIGCHPAEVEGYPGEDPVTAMLTAAAAALADHGVDPSRVNTFAEPAAAIAAAFAMAAPGDLLVVLAEPAEVVPLIDRYLSGSGTTPPRR